jgi:hypothetical protein
MRRVERSFLLSLFPNTFVFSFCSSLIDFHPNSTSPSSNRFIIIQTPSTMRKRATTDDEAPALKRHHPDAVEQLLETMKFQQKQIEKATNIWVRLKGGEDRLGDANTIFLGLVRSAMYSGSLAVKLVERQHVDIEEHK